MSGSDQPVVMPMIVKFSNWRRSYVVEQEKKGYVNRKRTLLEILTFNYIPCALTSTILAPLNRIKLILQIQNFIPGLEKINAREIIQNIIKEEGYRNLYKGNMIYNYKIFAQISAKTLFFDRIKNRNEKTKELIQNLKYKIFGINFILDAIAAASASMMAIIMTYPFDLAYARKAGGLKIAEGGVIFNSPYVHFGDCFHARDYETKKGFFFEKYYHGGSVAVFESFVFSTITLLGYQFLYRNNSSKNNENNLSKIIGPASVSLFASLLCYPIDTLKRTLQVNGMRGFKLNYNNLNQAVGEFMTDIRPFYRGFSFHIMRTIPFSYLQYYIFCSINNGLKGLKKTESK